jgi:hypothetical protein
VGEHAEALRELDRCLALSPRPAAELFVDRARARVALGQLDLVPEEYTRALAVRRAPELYAARGWARVVADAPRLARADFEAALELRPDCADARVGLGYVAALAGDHRRGAAEAARALRQEQARGAAPSPRLLYKAARAFAQAAGAAAASADPGVRAFARQVYAPRAVELLGQALAAEDPGRRAAFWRQNVVPDDALAPVKETAEFANLAARWGTLTAHGR